MKLPEQYRNQDPRVLASRPRYPDKPQKLPHVCAPFEPLIAAVQGCEKCEGDGHHCLLCGTSLYHYNNGTCETCVEARQPCVICTRWTPDPGGVCRQCRSIAGIAS